MLIFMISSRDYERMSLWICPLCGKQVSIRYYDPSGFADDIVIIQLRGLGRGRGFEVVSEYSLFEDEDTELLDIISDRVAVLYNLLYEDKGDDEDEEKEDDGEEGEQNGELLDLVNDVLADIYEERFSDLGEAVEALVDAFLEK